MLEWGNFLLVEGGTDSDREVARGIQHEAPALGTRLQAPCPGGPQPLGSKSIFTAHGCDIKTLTSPGLTNQAGHPPIDPPQSPWTTLDSAPSDENVPGDAPLLDAAFSAVGVVLDPLLDRGVLPGISLPSSLHGS